MADDPASSRPKGYLDPKQQELVSEAWRLVQRTIRIHEKRWPGPDYQGFVAERMVMAIPRFDASRNLKLITFAMDQARHACLDAIRRHNPHRIGPLQTRRPLIRLHSIESIMINEEKDGDLKHHEANCLAYTPGFSRIEQIDRLLDVARGASERERVILIGYYYDCMDFQAIGRSLGVSGRRVCAIHARLLRRLREQLTRRTA